MVIYTPSNFSSNCGQVSSVSGKYSLLNKESFVFSRNEDPMVRTGLSFQIFMGEEGGDGRGANVLKAQ